MSPPVDGSSAVAKTRPLVSVIVPTLNEERHIGAVLDDMLGQEGIDADVEILVIDGGSTDRTRAIVESYAATADVRLVDNPKRRQAPGFNLGIREARGTIVCVIHAHARFSKRYLAACFDARRRTGAANVGGVITHRGEGPMGEAIALAMSSPLGVGDSTYRHSKQEQFCDNIMGAFIDRKLFDEVGYYNESNIVNEDCEFNYRLRAAGYTVLVSPSIEVTYFVRSSLAGLAKQYLLYGFYRRWTEVQHPGSVPKRVYVPPALLVGLVCSAILCAFGAITWGLVLPAMYACVLALGAVDGMRRSKRLSVALREPAAIATMHFAFGLGWLRGFFTLRAVR
ncbi:MAG: glycosyltransferase family 2 protein [Candidatus Cybelea sp.]